MSELIFGTASLHHLPFARQRAALLSAALDIGFQSFDCAPAYGNGLSEAEIGRVIGGKDGCKITTKFGIPVDLFGSRHPSVAFAVRVAKRLFDRKFASAYGFRIFTAAEMSRSLEGSLRRLRRDHVDDLMLHDPLDALSEAQFGPLHEQADRLKQAGKICRWGVAGTGQLSKALATVVDVVQFPLAELQQANTPHRKIAFGVYRSYVSDGIQTPFASFVSSIMARDVDLNLILASTSMRTLQAFKVLF